MPRVDPRLLAVALGVSALGCGTEIIGDVEVEQAARIVERLEATGIGAEQELERGTDRRYTIRVAPRDATRALEIIVDEGLATQRERPSGSLVPSLLEQRQTSLAATATEIERSLLAVGGVVSARVHLAAAEPAPLSAKAEPTPASASVLLTYRDDEAPLNEAEIAKLVAGAVGEVAPERVNVVLKALHRAPPAERRLVTLGPVSVTAGTALTAKLLLTAALALFALSCGMLVILWRRARRAMTREHSGG